MEDKTLFINLDQELTELLNEAYQAKRNLKHALELDDEIFEQLTTAPAVLRKTFTEGATARLTHALAAIGLRVFKAWDDNETAQIPF